MISLGTASFCIIQGFDNSNWHDGVCKTTSPALGVDHDLTLCSHYQGFGQDGKKWMMLREQAGKTRKVFGDIETG